MPAPASIHHLTLATATRMSAFPGEARMRAAVRTLARVAGSRLALFALVDDHTHVIARATEAEAGRLGRALRLAFRALSPEDICPAHVRPVRDRDHLEELVRYCLVQPIKHGLQAHPATWTGSFFPDLVGARRVEGMDLAVASVLPRFRALEAYTHVGLPAERIEPADEAGVRGLGVARLAALAAEALAAGPVLGPRDLPSMRARAAVARLARWSGFRASDVAGALGISERGVHSILGRKPVPRDDLDVRAVRMRVALELAVMAAGSRPPSPLAAYGSGAGHAARAERRSLPLSSGAPPA